MVKSMTLDFVDFKVLLHDFEDLVSDKHYDKMDYRMWRKISSTLRPNDTCVFMEWDNHGVDITFGEESEWHHFVFGDNSFGDFMWENLLKDSDYEVWDDPWGDSLTHHPAYGYPLSTGYDSKGENKKLEKKESDEPKLTIHPPGIEFEYMTPEGELKKAWGTTQSTSSSAYEYNARNLKLDIAASEAIANCGDKIKAAGAATKERLLAAVPYNGVMAMSASEPSVSFAIDTKVDKAEFDSKLEALSEKIQAVASKYNNIDKKESSIMKGFNFDFGPMNANVVRMSIYGLAVKNKTGSWVAYDAKNEEIMDVDVFNFDGSKFMYRMPVAINDVAAGDVIVHMSVPMFVVGKSEDGKAVYAVDPVAGERKEIMLTKSPFGFNFVTKVVNFLGNAFNADASNPFGNLGLMMMLSEDNAGMKDMLPFMLMANGGNANGFDLSNPMVLYMMCKDGTGDLPMMLALSGAFNKPAPHVCNCGQHNQ